MITTKSIKLDVTRTYVEPINLVQYEKDARVLEIQLTAGSLPVNLTGANVVFYAKKPDNTIVFNACTVIDAVNGKIQYTVTEQTCVIAGDLRCWVLITSTGASLRSLEFTITVQPSEDDTSAVESTSEFTALETALSTVSAYDGRIAQNETDIVDANIAINSIPNKNYLINGNFDIWQRGTSQTSSGYGSDDKWQNRYSGSSSAHSQELFTVGQNEVPNNSKNYSRTVVTSVTDPANYAFKKQSIEDVTVLAGETVTLSFWAKADSSKNIAIEFLQYISYGEDTVNGIGVQKFTLTTLWQKFSTTIDMPSIIGNIPSSDSFTTLYFWFDAGSSFDSRTDSLGQQSGTFDIAQVKLEKGSIATPFTPNTYAEELLACQRYYEKSYSMDKYAGDSGVVGYDSRCAASVWLMSDDVVRFKVPKGKAPTVTVYSVIGAAGYAGEYTPNYTHVADRAVAMAHTNENSFRIGGVNGDFTVGSPQRFHWVADADL